ncbi:hypothetical protein AAFF_G00003710 [Aldrovandia affinis]|uniref:Uncharacterized protein n=1 Tax=Aldrovandia affinis TaxID=143900 RepID=A0AAD7X3C8_9TELE|nr:hypothetical protein AAFF_G00003710 [Aldrovandia affinis]
MQEPYTSQVSNWWWLTPSRNPLRDSTGTDTEDDVRAYVEVVITARAMSESKLDLIREATGNDAVMQSVKGYVRAGWPSHIPFELHGYYTVRASQSESDGLLLYQDRIVIPPAQQKDILDRIHRGHQGLTKCRESQHVSLVARQRSQDHQEGISVHFLPHHKACAKKRTLPHHTIATGSMAQDRSRPL